MPTSAATPHVVHRVLDQWGRGPTTLLGDAAHAFPPSQAEGANQALEDALVLTQALRLRGDPAEFLRRYERRRSPRVRLVSRMAVSEITMRPVSPVVRRIVPRVPAWLTGRGYLVARQS
jgi:FAD-dependent urate hydroxylase